MANGIDVLDLDPRHGGDHWLDTHGDRLPATRTHRTRSGGLHFLFRHHGGIRNSQGKLRPELTCGAKAVSRSGGHQPAARSRTPRGYSVA